MGNCVLSDTTVALAINKDELAALLPSDTVICKGDKIAIGIPIPGAYSWTNGTVGNLVSINQAGEYAFTVTNPCGIFDHAFTVEVKQCDCEVYTPNVFSPNGDGLNDYMECYTGCDFPNRMLRFQVFDRWGGLVYAATPTSSNPIRWDGFANGKPLDTGVYLWWLAYEFTRDGQTLKRQITGDVSIVR